MSNDSKIATTPSAQYLAINPNHVNAHIYTPAVVVGNTVYLSAKSSWIAPEPENVAAATTFLLDEVEKELKNAGSSMEQVLKVIVYLRDMNDYTAMNDAYVGRFGSKPPARTCIEAKLPRNSVLAFDVTAYI
jgi:2-iminobutanoate/2-iminopropanoate deaminase